MFAAVEHFLLPRLLATIEDHEVARVGTAAVHVARCLRQALGERPFQSCGLRPAVDQHAEIQKLTIPVPDRCTPAQRRDA